VSASTNGGELAADGSDSEQLKQAFRDIAIKLSSLYLSK